MYLDAHLAERLDQILLALLPLDLDKGGARDREERVARPLGEPVDGAAVDERGKHATARAKRVAHRAHAQHDVQVVAHAVDEEGEYGVAVALGNAGLLGRRSAADHHALVLVRLEEVGHFAAVQYVVDVLEELLHDDLRVGEEKDRVLVAHARLLVELLEVVVERVVVVAARQLDLKALVAAYVAGEARQRLLARSAHAHEERVAAILADHARDARYVLHGVHEEDHLDVLVVLKIEVFLVLKKKTND